MFIGRILSYKSPAGGPAPLLYNPGPKALRTVGILHVCLSVGTTLLVSFPLFIDAPGACDLSRDRLTWFIVIVIFLSLVIFVYYVYMAHKKMATEVQWYHMLIITAILVASETAAGFWGILILYGRITSEQTVDCSVSNLILVGIGCVVAGTCVCMLTTLYVFFRLTRLVFDMLTGVISNA